MKLLILGLFVSLNLFAADWNDLAPGQTYKLSQSFSLPQTERSSSLIDLMKGEDFTLKEIDFLELYIPVTLFIFKYNSCPGLGLKTSLEIIPVSETNVEVGATVENCELSVFVETKDTLKKSLFE